MARPYVVCLGIGLMAGGLHLLRSGYEHCAPL